jgi:hypothetical protein
MPSSYDKEGAKAKEETVAAVNDGQKTLNLFIFVGFITLRRSCTGTASDSVLMD